MDKGRIITHAKSNSSRVVLNNTVYENISSTGADRSGHGSVPESIRSQRLKQSPLESSQNTLVSRQYRNVNQKEQILLNTLEKNLSRQKQSALQSQAYSMQKYKQRLAGYERLRMSGGESISENCIPPPSDLLKCGDRQSRSKTVSGKSTHASSSISRAKQGDQSIAAADVNRAREDGQEGKPRVYNDAVSPCDTLFHQLPGETTISKDPSILTTILKSSKSRGEAYRTRKKLSFDDNTENRDMLRKPHKTSSTPDPNLLTVDEEGIRPRAYTDPTSDGKLKSAIKLPEIMIEDCSDPDDKSNTEEGMFTVFASPPRRRANTCPEEFFNRRRKGRPPTPPPTSRNSSPTNKFSFGPTNKSPVSFVHHKLSKVSEDGVEGASGGRSGGHMSRRSVPNRRSSLNSVSTMGTSLEHKLTLRESAPAPPCDISERTPPDGCHSVAKPEARKASENNNTPGVQNQGQDVSEMYSSKDCRFSQKMSPSLDGKPLEAC